MIRKFLLLLVCYLLLPAEIFGAALTEEQQPTKYFCGYKLKTASGINEFALLNYVYDHKDLTYMITDYTNKLSRTNIDNIIAKAFDAWAAVTDLRFTRIHSGKADVVIRFVVGDHGDGFPFDGRGNVLAHAYYGFVHFDDSENWSTHLDSGIINLYSVAVHEIGHVLGLDHSDIPKTMMYPSYDPYNVVMKLHGDDINGVQKLYGTNTTCQSELVLGTLHRLYKASSDNHFYTTSLSEANNAANNFGYIHENPPGSVAQSAEDCLCGMSLQPVYRLYRGWDGESEDHFYTQSLDEANNAATKLGFDKEGIEFYCADKRNYCGATLPLYRYYRGNDHFYTTSAHEGSTVVGSYEEIVCYIW